MANVTWCQQNLTVIFCLLCMCFFTFCRQSELLPMRPSRKTFNVSDTSSSEIGVQFDGLSVPNNSYISFSREAGTIGTPCKEELFLISNVPVSVHGDGGQVYFTPKDYKLLGDSWNICVKNDLSHMSEWTHLGKFKRYQVDKKTSHKIYENDITGTQIFGMRAEGERVSVTEEGFTKIPANINVTIRMFGIKFSNHTELAFINIRQTAGSICDTLSIIKYVKIMSHNVLTENVIEFKVDLPVLSSNSDFYVCVKQTFEKREAVRWIHQGDASWMKMETVGRLLPMWLQICIICFLLILSGLFSGLNLGLMALDRTELQVIENCGTETEKKYARVISPLRKRDDLTSGIIAIVGSTISIVVFGEIIPQAICSRHGLAIGAKTVYVTKFFMLATFPLSFPISKILDCVLGEEIGNVYDRERLMEFIRVTKDYNQLENEEVNIISGALELKNKTVVDVMTKISDVFMVPYNAVLNFETMSEIMKQGYSRIPVYELDRNNVVALLNIKDLAFVDPDENTALKTLCEFYNHPVNYVFEDETLDIMLNEFKKGRSHMAFVRHVNNEGDGDPFYEIIGVVTLEDVIEEILQSEIIDETDVLTDNRRKQRRKEAHVKQDFSDFAKLGGGQQGTNIISPQLALATYQFLSTSVEPFRNIYLSEPVLKRLMTQNIFFKSKTIKDGYSTELDLLYQAGKPADFFVLILEGRCRVTVCKENLVFETGPFSYFGIPAITVILNTDSSPQNHMQSLTSISTIPDNPASKTFIPDYTVVTITETLYMKIHWAVYLAAYRATLMERHHKLDSEPEEIFNNNWEQNFQFSSSGSLNHLQPDQNPSVLNHVQNNKINEQSPNSRRISFPTSASESAKRRSSVEVGSINRPDSVCVDVVSKNVKLKESGKIAFSNSSEIPLIDMPHNLESVAEDENCDAVDVVVCKKLKEGISGKKKSSVNGSEQTNERTRLLYPSEA